MTPSNEGRGYVLRRIMRRAMRHAHLLGAKDPLMRRLVPALVAEMGQAYPELLRAQALIVDTLKTEETRFRETLARGLAILDEETSGLGQGAKFSGDTAFKLYDTFGFPLDLTQDALRPRGIAVDKEAFNAAMARQRAEARKAWAGSGETATETLWFALKERLGATEFLGYDTEKSEGVVTALVHEGGRSLHAQQGRTRRRASQPDAFLWRIRRPGRRRRRHQRQGREGRACRFRVENTLKKLGDLIVHEGVVEDGEIVPGLALELDVAHDAPRATRANHSATHLLHEALRQVLGDHVAQKGSLVAPERLRFDFTHPKPLTQEELARVETLANEIIQDNAPVDTRVMAQDEAIESGARALFGEKYGDEVRVVAMGRPDPGAPHAFSIELCGGTHVSRTGDIGLIAIMGEGAVASGVRRIEARTAEGARTYLAAQSRALQDIAGLMRAPVEEAPTRLAQLIDERKRLERELADAKRKLAMGGGAATAPGPEARDIAGVKLLTRAVEGIDAKDLKSLVDDAKKSLGSGVVAIASASPDGKAGIVVGVTDDLTEKFSAVEFVRVASVALGGKGGGGRPDLAQAGGPNAAAIEQALASVEDALRGKAAQ